MAANGLKMEPGLVKAEPGMDDLDMADLDEIGYEDDTGELIFPKPIPTGWLLRVPKELWELLAHVDDNEDITLGQVRIWDNSKDPRSKEKETIRLTLNPHIPGKDLRMTPKLWDLSNTSTLTTKNTFIFSEKNLPHFNKNRTQQQDRGQRADLLAPNTSDSRVQKPRGPRTIPKRTEYTCTATKELVCTPHDNAEYRSISATKRTQQSKARHFSSFIADQAEARALEKKSKDDMLADETFVTASASIPGVSSRKRAQDNKATRLPEYELIDELHKLYKEYKYWPMSALRARLRQPEAWLKEVLGRVGVLVRTGQAANTWMLRPENDLSLGAWVEGDNIKAEDVAKEEDVKEEGSEDDDEDVDFEDVPA